MTRRIVLAILALICALLGTVVIPLGLITAEHAPRGFPEPGRQHGAVAGQRG